MKLNEAQVAGITRSVNGEIDSVAEHVADKTENVLRVAPLKLNDALEFGSKLEQLYTEIRERVEETVKNVLVEFNA